MLRILLLALAISFTQGTLQTAGAQSVTDRTEAIDTLTEDQKVQRLIEYVRTLEGATFIRDNSEFSPDKAASHLASKWQKHAEKIKTAEGFVMKLASESSSGTPYSIRFADGTTQQTRDVLMRQLNRLAAK